MVPPLRTTVLAAIVLISAAWLAASFPVAGQGAGIWPTLELVVDAPGDVVAGSYSNPAATVPVSRPEVDILALSASETDSSILAVLQLAALPTEPDPFSPFYVVGFTFADQPFVVYVSRNRTTGLDGPFEGVLYKGTVDSFVETVAPVEVALDARATAWSIDLPKALLGAVTGTVPLAGHELTGWVAQARSLRPVNGDFWVGDRADPGPGAVLRLQFGLPQSGPLRLSTPTPYIVSNGLATSYPVPIRLQNTLDVEQVVRLQVPDLPSAWQATLPDAVIRIAPKAEQDVTFVLTVPFRHQHGSIDRYHLVALDASDRSIGELDLGIVYTATPQPAGHHDALFLHSGITGGFLNTLEEDGADTGEPIRSAVLSDSVWDLKLEPRLAVGLDLDLARNGTLDVAVRGWSGAGQLSLDGSLLVEGPAGSVEVATLPAVSVFAAEPRMGDVTFSTQVVPLPAGDLVPFVAGTDLVLRLRLSTLANFDTVVGQLSLLPGAQLELPLFDYHPDVDAALRDIAGLSWETANEGPLRVRPGDRAAVPVTLTAEPGRGHRITVQADSAVEGLVTFVGEADVLVDADHPLRGEVLLAVPQDAVAGQPFDAVLVAHDASGSGALAILRLTVLADPEAPPQPALEEEGAEKDAPGAWGLSAAVALALALMRRRRLPGSP